VNFVEKLLITLACALIFLISPPVTSAATLAEQTVNFSSPFYVWQVIQELGSNLSGKAGTFTFRVSTSRTNLNQFDYTAQNSRIYDKENNTFILGCIPRGADPGDRLAGLTFNTEGVPPGYEDVSIDFSCRDYDFIPGHRYLIFITNANMGNSGSGNILFAAAAYGTNPNLDYFTGGGVRYGNGNPWDYYHNSGRCNPVAYLWNDQTINPVSGCNIWTSPKDDLYFILSNTSPPIPSKTPLILIPGIGGSELKVGEDIFWNQDDGHGGTFNRAYAKDEIIWVNESKAGEFGDDDYFDVLRMKTDGVSSEANLDLTGNLYTGAYQETINFFTSIGYTLNEDLFIFPYDWRKDISLTADILDTKINQIKSQTGTAKVDIVAHSMGGLVARNYIADSNKAQNVRKLFTLGTPHLGSPKLLQVIRYGYCLLIEVGPFCLSIAPSEMQDVIQNMISGYQLAPSQTYFNFYSDEDNSHPYPYRTEEGALNYTQIKNLLTTLGHNTALFNPSETFHSLDSNLSNTNGIDVAIITGSGQPTLGQIIELTLVTLNGNVINFKDKRNINGDGTVPLLSAAITDPHKGLFLNGSAKVYYSNQEHGGLVTSGPSLNLVKNILAENSDLPNGISETPYKMVGHELSVHSPVNIHVYDSSGNHTGPTAGGFETNIPGSSYDTLDDAKFIYLPDDGIYNVNFEATDQGTFDFKIRKFENDENTETILYNDISLTNNTKAATEFNTNSNQPPILQVDNDGNGTIDATINSTSTSTGTAVDDLTPPQTEIQLSGTAGLDGWYKSNVTVTLNARDEENGSGILKTEYTLDGQTINTYNEPFTVSEEKINKLKVKSTDNAGNEENPNEQEIKIDKTSPEAKIFADLDKLDLLIEGVDTNPVTVTIEDNIETKKKENAVYKLTDSAGNTLRIDVREVDKDKKDKLRLYSVQYNDNPPQVLENNHFNVNYQGKKDKINVKEQNFELKGEVKIRIKYNSKKNESAIIVKEPKEEKVKEIRNGLVILQLLTNEGQLKTSY